MLSTFSWEEMLLAGAGGSDVHILLTLRQSGETAEAGWGWDLCGAGLVSPAEGISEGWAVSAVPKGG